MEWCSRHGLHLAAGPAGGGGRHSSYSEWAKSVQARRARASPRPLFLDTMLQVGGGGGGGGGGAEGSPPGPGRSIPRLLAQ